MVAFENGQGLVTVMAGIDIENEDTANNSGDDTDVGRTFAKPVFDGLGRRARILNTARACSILIESQGIPKGLRI